MALSDLLSPLDLDDHVAQFVRGDPRDPLVHERPEYLEVLQAQQWIYEWHWSPCESVLHVSERHDYLHDNTSIIQPQA